MSEVKTMSSIQFPNTQQPYQVQDQRIPENPGANKQFSTDAEGRMVWLDRPTNTLPDVTANNNGQFLRVVNGAWAADTVPNAEGVSF